MSTANSPHHTMPVLFTGHGSPMNILEDNHYTRVWGRLGRELPRPRAILCISAHWLTSGSEVTLSASPRQIYDFHGFPEELYQIRYSPAGSPEVAREIAEKVGSVTATETWGLDHGTWAVLHHTHPAQDIPTLQLSLDSRLSPQQHLELAQKLKFLRHRGVLMIGSGNVVHNLRQLNWEAEANPHPWALDFEQFVLDILLKPGISHAERVKKIFNSPDLSLAHPSVEHLLPLIYILGASDEEELPTIEARGIQNAAISMATLRYSTLEK